MRLSQKALVNVTQYTGQQPPSVISVYGRIDSDTLGDDFQAEERLCLVRGRSDTFFQLLFYCLFQKKVDGFHHEAEMRLSPWAL